MKLIPVSGAKLATYVEGKGPPVIFIHGGPGDTHHYMMKMATPLFKDYRCIFFDQRGTGASEVERRESDQFSLEMMLEDLYAVQKYYRIENASLVGHSWGAMYGLFACMNSPGIFGKAALLNMGPLDDEIGKQTSENLFLPLTDEERAESSKLRVKRNKARDRGDLQEVLNADKEMMRFRVKAWVFDPKLHQAFLEDYFQDPPPDRDVNKWVWDSLDGWFDWKKVPQANSKIWLCVGENDSVPLAQAQRLEGLLPNASLSIFKKCGHIPWLEHPARFYSELKSFLD